MRTVAQWLGSEQHRRWEELVQFVADRYQRHFSSSWRYTQVRHNWELRFRHGRTMWALLPSRGHFLLRVTLTPREEEHLRELRSGESLPTGREQWSDVSSSGRVLTLAVDDADSLEAAKQLLAVKRPPRYVPG